MDILTNEKINQKKIHALFGCKMNADAEYIFPIVFSPLTDLPNVCLDALCTTLFKILI